MHIAAIYIGLSLLVGVIGRNRKLGFFGYFFASLLFSPLMGLLLVFCSDKRKPAVGSER